MVDRESEMSESNDESNSKSENDDVDKEKVSEPCNPYIEHYVNQARSCQTYPAEKLYPNCDLRYTP